MNEQIVLATLLFENIQRTYRKMLISQKTDGLNQKKKVNRKAAKISDVAMQKLLTETRYEFSKQACNWSASLGLIRQLSKIQWWQLKLQLLLYHRYLINSV